MADRKSWVLEEVLSSWRRQVLKGCLEAALQLFVGLFASSGLCREAAMARVVFPLMGGCAPSPSTHWSMNHWGNSLPFSLRRIKSHPIYLFWGNTVVLLWERLLVAHIFIDLCAFLPKAMLNTGTKSVISLTLALLLSPLNQTGAQTKPIPTSTPPPTPKMAWPKWVGHSLYYNKIFCCIFPCLLCSPVLGFCLFNFIIASILIFLYDFFLHWL